MVKRYEKMVWKCGTCDNVDEKKMHEQYHEYVLCNECGTICKQVKESEATDGNNQPKK